MAMNPIALGFLISALGMISCAQVNAEKTRLPIVQFGAFNSNTTMREAAKLAEQVETCEADNDLEVVLDCHLTVVGPEDIITMRFSPSGELLEAERMMAFPREMKLSEALSQASQNYGSLGQPMELVPQDTINLEGCSPFGKRPPCGESIAATSTEVYGLEWSQDDPTWTLKVVHDKRDVNVLAAKKLEIPPTLKASSRLLIKWINFDAIARNHARESSERDAARQSQSRAKLKF